MGSTFEIRHAARELAQCARDREAHARHGAARPSRRTRRTIRTVVIDDNEDARELLSDLLQAKGYEVLSASDGPTGVDLIREHRPRRRPRRPRLAGHRRHRRRRDAAQRAPDLKTRLVALTGYGEACDRERTEKAGFHAHLVKPATAAALFACLSQQLDETS